MAGPAGTLYGHISTVVEAVVAYELAVVMADHFVRVIIVLHQMAVWHLLGHLR